MANDRNLAEKGGLPEKLFEPKSSSKRGGYWPRELFRFQREFDRMFSDFFSQGYSPLLDVDETDTHYLIGVELPGVKKDDVKVELKGNSLVISGEKKNATFMRSFTLPAEIKSEDVKANYVDGVLEIAIPKGEAGSGKKIEIGENKDFLDRVLEKNLEKKSA